MANGHGGARPGSGRKPRAERFASEIELAERRCADRLPQVLDNLELIADGESPKIEERWEAAGSVMIEVQAKGPAGELLFTPSGRPSMVKALAFPGRGPEELVLVERKVITAGPDFKANEYLADRILGKPTAAVELTGKDGEALEVIQVYLPDNGRDARHATEAPGDPAQ